MPLVTNHPDVTRFVIEATDTVDNIHPTQAQSIGVVTSDDPPVVLGGILYTDYTGVGGSVTMHAAGTEGKHWTSKAFFWAIFDYPFNVLHVNRCVVTVPSDNLRALKLDLQLGFQFEAVVRGFFPQADMIVLTMERKHCRFLMRRRSRETTDGQESQEGSAAS